MLNRMINKRVLIIEDDLVLQNQYAQTLTKANLDVLSAHTGEEGVSIALEQRPELILIDVMLPDISGYSTVKKIRADLWGRTANIIYLTNRGDTKKLSTAVEQGNDEYIVKTFTTDKEFLKRIQNALVM